MVMLVFAGVWPGPCHDYRPHQLILLIVMIVVFVYFAMI
jgi:hypothetical protein